MGYFEAVGSGRFHLVPALAPGRVPLGVGFGPLLPCKRVYYTEAGAFVGVESVRPLRYVGVLEVLWPGASAGLRADVAAGSFFG